MIFPEVSALTGGILIVMQSVLMIWAAFGRAEEVLATEKEKRMRIDEASAKLRTGQPVDDEEDYALRNLPGVDTPDHVHSVKLG